MSQRVALRKTALAPFATIFALTYGLTHAAVAADTVPLHGTVRDVQTNQPIPCRLYITNERGESFFAKSESRDEVAVEYRKQRGNSAEMHTSLSPHPFVAELPSGKYTLHFERGKEYLPATETVTLDKEPVNVTIKLRRWINMAERGWYSGETHVHRSPDELPTVMLAEGLNVAFPLTYWVTKAFTPPASGDKTAPSNLPAKLVEIDRTHVYWPRNTEWEIFTVRDKPHTLGAIFAINHKEVFDLGAPPVLPIAERARKEGALLELDKHNWPWSMALVPVMKVDLYELSNNHVWRTTFGFPNFGETAPDYMRVETNAQGFTERGWIDYGFQNYYALLNCGFRLRPTAGTASGVHPVPLGFGRVYVHLPDGFGYDAWVKGLNAGNSFVTTGPMLLARFNDRDPGHTFSRDGTESTVGCRVSGTAFSEQPLERIEIVSAGETLRTLKPENRKLPNGGYESPFDVTEPVGGSTWLAVRCYEPRPDNRLRFAHTAPVYFDVPGQPLRPRKVEVDFLIGRIKSQIDRSRDALPEEALAEYRRALEAYEKVAKTAR